MDVVKFLVTFHSIVYEVTIYCDNDIEQNAKLAKNSGRFFLYTGGAPLAPLAPTLKIVCVPG